MKLIAAFCIANVFSILPDLASIYGPNAFIHPEANESHIFWYQPTFALISVPLSQLGIPEMVTILNIIFIYLLSCFGMFTGRGRFVCSIIAWFLHLMMVNSNSLFNYGADNMITVMLVGNILFCVPVKANSKYSFIHRYGFIFLQIQLCFIYFFGGLGKILGTTWLDGNAIWYVFNIYCDQVWDLTVNLTGISGLFALLSISIVLLELFYPILINIPSIGKWIFYKVILMHLGIGVIMGLHTFAAVMILMNVIAYGHYIKWSPIKKRIQPAVVLTT